MIRREIMRLSSQRPDGHPMWAAPQELIWARIAGTTVWVLVGMRELEAA